MKIADSDVLAAEVRRAITTGDLLALQSLLRHRDGLAAATITSEHCGVREERSMLHVATDWPGHFPNGAESVRLLVEYGADVNARFAGAHHERPLHWAASSNDVAVLDALLDLGADIEADGSVIDGGTAMADAVAFGQWDAARHLLARGARTNLWQAAALGLMDRVRELASHASPDELTNAFWCACHGGQLEPAQFLAERGANVQWTGYDGLTPLAAAERAGARGVVEWLRGVLSAGC